MLLFEIRKVFSKPANKINLFLLVVILAVVCYFAVLSVEYVDEDGNSETGVGAARELRERKAAWAGELTEEVLLEVLRQNARINASEEYLSEDVQENNKAYAKKQGFSDIRDLINRSFCGFREYDYYRADSVTEEEVSTFYQNRTEKLTEWLCSDEAVDQFSEEERGFLIRQYTKLETPFYYESADGWKAFLEYAPSLMMPVVLLAGFLVSGIFANEFQWKADSVFFSTKYGRDKATASKVGAGFLIATAVYWASVLLYSAIVLGILGTGGAGCAIQTGFEKWKSFYNITYFEAYLLTLLGGYIGSLFILTLSMLVSAKMHSSVLAVAIPFLLIFLPSFVSSLPVLSGLLGLFPDQLLQVGKALNFFNIYRIGGKLTGAIPILLILYTVLFLLMLPVLYLVYRKTEIRS